MRLSGISAPAPQTRRVLSLNAVDNLLPEEEYVTKIRVRIITLVGAKHRLDPPTHIRRVGKALHAAVNASLTDREAEQQNAASVQANREEGWTTASSGSTNFARRSALGTRTLVCRFRRFSCGWGTRLWRPRCVTSGPAGVRRPGRSSMRRFLVCEENSKLRDK